MDFKKRAADTASNNDFSFIEELLFRKKSRPKSLHEQIDLLMFIRDMKGLPAALSINAATATLYKLMEAGADYNDVHSAIKWIEGRVQLFDKLEESDHFRYSKTHLKISTSFCIIQSYIYLNDKILFEKALCETTSYILDLDLRSIGISFYSIFHNLIRVLVLYVLYCLKENNNGIEDLKKEIDFIIRAVKIASKYISLNYVRFEEYASSLTLLDCFFSEINRGDFCLLANKKLMLEKIFHVNKNKDRLYSLVLGD